MTEDQLRRWCRKTLTPWEINKMVAGAWSPINVDNLTLLIDSSHTEIQLKYFRRRINLSFIDMWDGEIVERVINDLFSPVSDEEMLQYAIEDNPDDQAVYSAYIDYRTEKDLPVPMNSFDCVQWGWLVLYSHGTIGLRDQIPYYENIFYVWKNSFYHEHFSFSVKNNRYVVHEKIFKLLIPEDTELRESLLHKIAFVNEKLANKTLLEKMNEYASNDLLARK